MCAHRGMGYFQHSNKAQPGTFSCAGASECLSLVTHTAQSAGACSRAVHSPCLKAETLRGTKELLKLGSSIGCINPHNIEWEFKSKFFPKVQLKEGWHVLPGVSLKRRQVVFELDPQ